MGDNPQLITDHSLLITDLSASIRFEIGGLPFIQFHNLIVHWDISPSGTGKSTGVKLSQIPGFPLRKGG